ncbi:Glycerophosphodiester phosphodiesterase domain-containing protein, partial [Cantharellus anzutake]|uniref:Glycerophosphodiester phosphodiesterase domain-containing protein n=1 Tax=Cantharellus anzutake TaxID=1750568 RepID=UPI00190771D3
MPIASLSSIGLSSSVHHGPSPSSPSIRSPAVTATAGNKIALSSLSGEFVHLVIQVTRDFIPVVCPEWNVPFVMNDQKEPLVDVGVADLSADQFQRLVVVAGRTSDAKLPLAQLSSASEWQRCLSGSFCTLTEVLKALPLKYGVSLELRYPNPVIRQRYSLGRNHEPNEFVDSVLRTVYSALATHSGAFPRRKIVFSSFVPTICTAINWKQPNYAVFFASKGGVARPAGNDTGVLLADEEEIDTRCRSISAAVNFARNNNLLGLILNASILQQVPSLILGIKEHGVMLAAFGNTNLLPLSSATGTSTKVDAMLTEGVLTFV